MTFLTMEVIGTLISKSMPEFIKKKELTSRISSQQPHPEIPHFFTPPPSTVKDSSNLECCNKDRRLGGSLLTINYPTFPRNWSLTGGLRIALRLVPLFVGIFEAGWGHIDEQKQFLGGIYFALKLFSVHLYLGSMLF